MLAHNAHQVAARLAGIPAAVRSEVDPVFARQVQAVARTMRDKAPKFRTTLTNSVAVENRGPLDAIVKPGTAYAYYKEKGTKPGSVPRFFDPKAADLIAWLESKVSRATGEKRKPRRGTAKFTARELELRDRYEGLARHIRRRGTKAQPFVEPTAQEMAPIVARELRAAVLRGLAKPGPAAGSAP